MTTAKHQREQARVLRLVKQANEVGHVLSALSWDDLSNDEFYDVVVPLAAKYLKTAQTAADYLAVLRKQHTA